MKAILRVVYFVGCLGMMGWILNLVFIAGLSLFVNPLNWGTHAQVGWITQFPVVALFILALIARMPRTVVLLTLGLMLLVGLQITLPMLRQSLPVVSALHPVNAFAIFTVTVILTRRAWGVLRAESVQTEREAVRSR